MNQTTASQTERSRSGFSLIEILVSCAVLSVILLLMLSVLNQTGTLWKNSNDRMDAFQGARLGFENLTRLLSQTSLNTYWDYAYDEDGNPNRFIRKSELHFLIAEAGSTNIPGTIGCGQTVFFQAPAKYTREEGDLNVNASYAPYDALTDLLNSCAFYVEFASDRDKGWVPAHVKNQERRRFRLMQWTESTQKLAIYDKAATASDDRSWIKTDRVLTDALPVAENIIALVIWPKEPERQTTRVLPDAYVYDSRLNAEASTQPANAHQLPPMLQVAMVAMDEGSASRLGDQLQSVVEGCLEGKFVYGPSRFEDDLKALEQDLADNNIIYRSFVSTIPMREAKWSP